MKAFLLAAGKGTRLQPFTLTTPKCLMPIGDRPLLKIWYDLMEKYDVSEVLINTHHLPDQVTDYIQSMDTPIRTKIFYEKELLGSAGTLIANKEFVRSESSFLILYADNLTPVNLDKLSTFHSSHDGLFTMGLFHAPEPEKCGIVTLAENGRIENFIEKPVKPVGNLANAGVIVASPEIFEEIPESFPLDLSRDVMPKFIGRLYGQLISDYFIDIGSPENYEKACNDWDRVKDLF